MKIPEMMAVLDGLEAFSRKYRKMLSEYTALREQVEELSKANNIKCPYCKKVLRLPETVYFSVLSYGPGFKRFKCMDCGNVVAASVATEVVIREASKSSRDSDWSNC